MRVCLLFLLNMTAFSLKYHVHSWRRMQRKKLLFSKDTSFSSGSAVKSACSVGATGDIGSIPGSGRSTSWRRAWHPTAWTQRSLRAIVHKESDSTEVTEHAAASQTVPWF